MPSEFSSHNRLNWSNSKSNKTDSGSNTKLSETKKNEQEDHFSPTSEDVSISLSQDLAIREQILMGLRSEIHEQAGEERKFETFSQFLLKNDNNNTNTTPVAASSKKYEKEEGNKTKNNNCNEVEMVDLKKTSKQESAEKFFWPPMIYTNLTKEYSLSRFPECVGKYLLPSGVWAVDQRDFNRHYGALFFTYNSKGSSWAPAAGLIFLLIVAIISALTACKVPLNLLGAIHAVFGLVFIWKRPARIPLDNILVVLQYFAGAALAFSKGNEFASYDVFFMCILAIVLVSVAHGLIQLILEECVLFPAEFLKFKTMDEEEDQLLQKA